MRTLSIAIMAALLAGLTPVRAQTPNINLLPEFQTKSPEEKALEAERDKAYRESLKKIPDAKGSSDPWGGVRSGDAPAPKTATSAKPKAKSGNTAN